MNRNRYRLVFNKLRGLLMAVAETASSQGKHSSESRPNETPGNPAPDCHFGLLARSRRGGACLLLGVAVLQAIPLQALAQIAVDHNAPKSQQPTVLNASNGVPQINIQTPNGNGVSRNTYTQFDVQRNGVILNNSRTDTQTQLGGWVQGNPWLAAGTARVILNEVNSNNPSLLKGYIEVAGDRAQVVIANPSGISCDGCGFVNANRATLTTGTPIFGAGGSLDAYRVQGGIISIDGAGMDASRADYTDIIARAVQINAGLWANNLKITAGANQVNAAHSSITPITGTGAAPSYAIDVAALGGMYAGKIYLVGTESGLGVRNAGQIGASAGEVVVTVDGRLENSGKLSSAGIVSATATAVHNSGVIYAKDDLGITTQGDIQNDGQLLAQGNIKLAALGTTSRIDNGTNSILAAGLQSDGSLAGSGGITANATQGITALGSNVSAGDQTYRANDIDLHGSQTQAANLNLTADTGGVNLASATVVSSQTLNVTAAQAVTTDSAKISAKQVQITATDLSNKAGFIGTQQDMTLSLSGKLDNSQGLLWAGGPLTATADTIDNHQSVVAGASPDNKLGIQGKSVALTAGSLDNTSSFVLADDSVDIQASRQVANQRGTIASASTVNVRDVQTTRSLSIDNTDGNVVAGSELTLTSRSYTGAGSLSSQGKLSFTTDTDTTQSGTVQSAGDMNVQVAGSLVNQGSFSAGNKLTVNAATLNNETTGSIEGTSLVLRTTDSFSNRGIINGGDTFIDTSTLNNLGTGRIYGDHVAISATTLNNVAENGMAPVIAARNRADIGVGTLNNRDGALIYSAGNMSIGGALDADHLATGTATSINNSSATIESAGDLSLDALSINNVNNHFSATYTAGTQRQLADYFTNQGIVNSDSVAWAVGTVEPQNTTNYFFFPPRTNYLSNYYSDSNVSFVLLNSPYADPRFRDYYAQKAFTDSGYQFVPNPDNWIDGRNVFVPGSASQGGGGAVWALFGMTAPGYNLPAAPDPYATNSSWYLDGPNYIYPGNESNTQYQADYAAWKRAAQPWAQLQAKMDAMTSSVNSITGYSVYRNYTETQPQAQILSSAPATLRAGGNMVLNARTQLSNDKSQILAGGDIAIAGAAVTNVAAQVSALITRRGTLSSWGVVGEDCDWFSCDDVYGWRRSYYAEDIPKTLTLNVSQVQQHMAPGGGTSITVGALSGVQNVRVPQGTSEVRFTSASVVLPQNSLYTNHIGEGRYIVETDPRFTDRRTWLSSDYMLNALSLDPALSQKRLGDGFYEQQLIREQVSQLTGRRFLAGYASDEVEYQALMDAGVTFAKAHNLVPGVALSAEQIAQLTSDIVWLETQTVKLPDGSTQQVLVPHLYVRLQPNDLDGSGTLLSGNSVKAELTGNLINSGTIAGRQLLALTADNLQNLTGRMEAQTAILLAKNDITNQGGTIQAKDALALIAGRDIKVESTVLQGEGRAGAGRYNSTAVDRIAGLYVTGEGGQLQVSAGRDISLTAATVAGAKDSTVSLQAGRDLSLGTVTKGEHSDVTWDSQNYARMSRTEEIGSKVSGGNVELVANRDVALRAATVAAQDNLTVLAGGNLIIQAGQSTQSLSAASHVEGEGLFSSGSGTLRNDASLTRNQGSTLSGANIVTQSGADTQVVASRLSATQSVSMTAGGNLDLLAGADTVSRSISKSHDGDIFGGYSDNSANHDETRAAVTRIEAQGKVSLQSGNDTTLQATQVRANSLDIQAGVVNEQVVNPNAKVNLLGVIETTQDSVASRGGDVFWAEMSGKGSVQETLKLPDLQTSGATRDAPSIGADSKPSATDGTPLALATPSTITTNLIPTITAPGGVTVGATRLPMPKEGSGGGSGEGMNTTPVDLKAQAQALAQQPGLGWLADFTKRKDVDWQAIQLASKKWEYDQAGLTPTGAAVVVIIVTILTWGSGTEAAGTATEAGTAGATEAGAATATEAGAATATTAGTGAGAAAGTGAAAGGVTTTTTLGGTTLATTTAAGTTYTAYGAALNAGFSTLASQAAVSLINNQGDLGKTLKELSSSDSIKQVLASMATAGALNYVGGTDWMQKFSKSTELTDRIVTNMVNSAVSATVQTAVLGGKFENNLKASLSSGGINAVAGWVAGNIGDWYAKTDMAGAYLEHKIAHALLGCATAKAKGTDCGSGALGAAVGETFAEFYGDDGSLLTPEKQQQVLQLAKLVATATAALTGKDIAAAGDAAVLSVSNNWLASKQKAKMEKELAQATTMADKLAVYGKYFAISAKQDVLTTSGLGKGLVDAGMADLKGLADFLKDPAAGLAGLYQIVSDPAVRARIGDQMFADLDAKFTRMNTALTEGGDVNAEQLGKDLGSLIWQVGTVVTGAASVAEVGTKLAKLGVNLGSKALDTLDLASQLLKRDTAGVGGVVKNADTVIEWGGGVAKQGKPWEAFMQKNLPEGTLDLNVIKKNFEAFDHLTPDGVAISDKTLNTLATSYAAKPSSITSTLNGYVNDMVNFTKDGKGTTVITNEMISAKQMQLAIPYSTTADQMAAIAESIKYAASQRPPIKIIVTKVR